MSEISRELRKAKHRISRDEYGPKSAVLRQRDENTLRFHEEAKERNAKRSLTDKLLGRKALTAVDIAHEYALVEVDEIDALEKIWQKS